MAAKDKYHDVVIRALEKYGWAIEREQVILRIFNRYLQVDLSARSGENSILVMVEIKGFEGIRSLVDYFYSVIGQYVTYRAIIEETLGRHPLYSI